MRLLVGLLLACALAACTTIREVEEGKSLLAEGRTDEGLAKLEQAALDNPRSAQARGAFVGAREQIVNGLIQQAESARAFGDFDDAERRYLRALRIDPSSVFALRGLDAVAQDRRHARLVAEAEAALKQGALEAAGAKAQSVLAENGSHRGARSVMRRVAEGRSKVATTPPQLKAALGKPVTLEFRDANIRSVFEVISRTSGINFVFDRDVRPDLRVTIFVRNTNLDDVLKILLVTNQLERKIINENSVLIFPNTPAKLKDYQELVVRSFYVANADVKQTAAMIRALVKTRDLFIDEKLNLIVMKDTAEAVRLAEKLVATQDLGEPEVMLEVEVLEIASSRVRELGLRFPEAVRYGAFVPGGTGTGGGVGTGSGVPPLVDLRDTSGWTFFTTNPIVVANLRQVDGVVNLLANPRIRVKNRDKAKVHIGERVPVFTSTSTANVGVSTGVSYLEVGLKLDVEPNVFLENEVAMKVQLEVSNILEQITVNNTLAYRLGTRNTATTLRLRDGETQVLAGLISDEDRVSTNRVPGIGELPLLGRLFSNPLEQRTKTEIVLLITPRVVHNLARPDSVPAEFPSGTESTPGAPPLQLQPTAPRALSLAPSTGAPPAAPAGKPAPETPAAAAVNLLFAAPAQVQIGREFVVSFGLPAGTPVTRAQVELSYDPKVVTALAAQAGADPGRAIVEITSPGIAGAAAAPPTEVRFRVVGTTPGASQIAISNASGTDAAGNAVGITAPASHALTVVPAQ